MPPQRQPAPKPASSISERMKKLVSSTMDDVEYCADTVQSRLPGPKKGKPALHPQDRKARNDDAYQMQMACAISASEFEAKQRKELNRHNAARDGPVSALDLIRVNPTISRVNAEHAAAEKEPAVKTERAPLLADRGSSQPPTDDFW